jgi:L-aspartate semialdehyde sulfurtransferase ferredoxin
MKEITRRYVMKFPPQSADKALSYRLIKDYDIKFNILKAEIRPGRTGSLLLELEALPDNIQRGIEYLEANAVICEPLGKKIKFEASKCINCGNCTGVCFTGALTMDREKWKLNFEPELCVVCELCVVACPMNLFDINFHEEEPEALEKQF